MPQERRVGLVFDDRYIPPTLDIAAAARLTGGLTDIVGRVEQRAEELALRAVEATDGGFLHVLVPATVGSSPIASVSRIEGGLRVTLASGRIDTIHLGGNSPGRVVIRRGDSSALVFQRTSVSAAKNF